MRLKAVFCFPSRFFALFLIVGLLSSCAGKTTVPADTTVNDDLEQITTTVESYGDIELPIEMTLLPKKSMAMRTDSFQGGIHVYSGKVEMSSLRDYIIASMRNHKWKMVGEASYNTAMLAFTKPNKTCMVVLTPGSAVIGKTEVSYYVTVDVAAVNRLNPFGEPIKQ